MGKEPIDFDISDIKSSNDVIVALRTVQQNQVRLNVLADQKANINIGFTLLFITLSQAPQVTDLATNPVVNWGVVLVIVAVAVSLTLALLVVAPRVGGTRIREPGQMANPFYFGMFTQVEQGSYVNYMLETLQHDLDARRMLLVDIYQIGRVLQRKYHLLRFSYGFLALAAILSAGLFAYKSLS